MEGHEDKVGQLKLCQEECIRVFAESMSKLSPGNVYEYVVTLQQDVMISRKIPPFMKWIHEPEMREQSLRCVISMGADYWAFISKGANAFLQEIAEGSRAAENNTCNAHFGCGVVTETPSCVRCRFTTWVSAIGRVDPNGPE